ncbi:hypothetical protein MTO96_032593 [Rhipicephalus appendiculatus]
MDAQRARQHRRSCFPKATPRPLFEANTSRRHGSSSQPPPPAPRNGLDPETASSTVRMRYAARNCLANRREPEPAHNRFLHWLEFGPPRQCSHAAGHRRDAFLALDNRHDGSSDEDDHLDLTATTRGARTTISDNLNVTRWDKPTRQRIGTLLPDNRDGAAEFRALVQRCFINSAAEFDVGVRGTSRQLHYEHRRSSRPKTPQPLHYTSAAG